MLRRSIATSIWARIIFTSLLTLLLQSCQSAIKPQGKEVKVTRVVSGQTLEVIDRGGQQLRIRLIGIDAPDLQQQPWGEKAKERLEAMTKDKSILLEFDVQKKDSFGRELAYAWQDEILLNEKLVAEGYVLTSPYLAPNHKYDRRFERAQQWARLMEQGIWNFEQPMRLTPSEFRRQHQKTHAF